MSVVDLVKPNDFFRDKVGDAVDGLNIDLDADLEFYLVNLLCEFIQPQNLILGDIDLLDTPLALIYKEALESSPQMQLKVYKKLGDISLYIAGYFQASLSRKTVGPGYYISMGSSAYQKMSSIMQRRYNELHFTEMYSNLSREFKTLVSVVTRIAGDLPIENHNLLKIYEKWCDTQSTTLKTFLENEGLSPDSVSFKKIQ
ncbi:hypothetical protein [Pseudobacteriovorax antillogorgiicola]|uniref:Uncharacterized protein n=1 Tax=Pseudobacteriovorax antillogorgiicola TaxID=1513793 RepID=A0A1Y6B8B3_9BACT|nr:hypothetical protein [Pseudobacteriovorax antillogorgiicola]TCS59297.1 hypothetical protein EDD56_101204 [Pseudobacteriovorax antillogorgiicola]SME89626.1 hypothetical protein SAMN06296036_101282 [Pseudobacteriovorax antillogorgiicola]